MLFHDTPTDGQSVSQSNTPFTVDHQCVAVNMASSESTAPSLTSDVEATVAANGVNGTTKPQTAADALSQNEGLLARTPSLTSLSLTEYSAKPTPPTEDRKTHMKNIVPDELLLPNGNPDVSSSSLPSLLHRSSFRRVPVS